MRLGLVLGAGGSAGEAYHRGVVRAMEELDLQPTRAAVVVGTSAGSIVAASLRRHAHPVDDAGPPAPARRGRLPRTFALELVRRPRQLLNAALLSPEFATGRTSIDFVRKDVAAPHSAWPAAPTYVVAVRRRDGKRVVFGRGDAPRLPSMPPSRPPARFPGWFSPIDIDGTSYVDGGLHSPTNADVVADLPLDLSSSAARCRWTCGRCAAGSTCRSDCCSTATCGRRSGRCAVAAPGS
jgi:NTE family protein